MARPQVWTPPMPYVPPPRTHVGRILLTIAVTLVFAVGLLFVFLLAHASGNARGTALTLVLAIVPVPFAITAYLWLDRYEPEPTRYLAAAVVWGGVVAVGIALCLELLVSHQGHVGDKRLATFGAPVIEESAKALFLVLILLRRRRELGGVVDGLVYAGLVGIGFAFTENVGYYAGGYSGTLTHDLTGARGATTEFVLRGLFSPFAHSMFASAFGIGMGVAVSTTSRWLRVAAPVLGLATGISLHGLWNGSMAYGGAEGFIVVYGAMMLPVFAGTVGLAIWARSCEGKVLVRALTDAAVRGWLHPDEIPYLSRFRLRRRARAFARRQRGRGAARATRDYQQLAAKMAFQHDRVMLGQASTDGADLVRGTLASMSAVRPWVLLPPPTRPAPPPAWPAARQ